MTHSAARLATVVATTLLALAGGASGGWATGSVVGPDAAEEASPSHAVDENDYKAGYTATPPGGSLRTARATFVLPELRCKGRHEGIGVGIGDEPGSGDPRYLAHVYVHCIGGAPSYRIRAYVPSRGADKAAFAGDTIRVSIRHTPDGSVIVKSADLTTGEQVRLRRNPPGAETGQVDFGSFPLYNNGMDPVPRFTPIRLRNAKINDGATGRVCIATTDPEKNTRVDPDTGEVEISTGDLTGCGFTLRWRSH